MRVIPVVQRLVTAVHVTHTSGLVALRTASLHLCRTWRATVPEPLFARSDGGESEDISPLPF